MIPKIIHYCWLGDAPYPPFINKCIESWKEHLPNYKFILWDKNQFDITKNKWVEQAYQANKFAFAADYIRFYALYHHGGIYLDADVQVLKSFDDLLQNKSFIGLESGGDFEAAIIGSEKGCEWVKKILDSYEGRIFLKENGQYDTKPLPLTLNELLRNYAKVPLVTKVSDQTFSLPKIFPAEYFSPKNFHTKEIKSTHNTYCIHHFDGQWIEKNSLQNFKLALHKSIIKLFGAKLHYMIVRLTRSIQNLRK